MGKKRLDFNDDLPSLRAYLAKRVSKQAKVRKPISAIEVGFQLCQAGLVLFHFDVRAKHERDGEWTQHLDGPTLELPHWQEAYESAEDQGASFTLLTGKPLDLPAGASDAKVAKVFGETLLAIVLDANATQVFDTLKLREDCQLDMEEFDNMWAWPAKYEDTGKTNLIRNLPTKRLAL